MRKRRLVLSLAMCVAGTMLCGSIEAKAQLFRAGSYYETSATLLCSNDFSCYLHYPVIPPAKWLMVQKVHCWIQRSVAVRSVSLGMTNGPTDSTFPRSIQLLATLMSTAGANNYVVASDVQFLIKGGTYPAMFVDTATAAPGWFNCQLIGKVLDSQP